MLRLIYSSLRAKFMRIAIIYTVTLFLLSGCFLNTTKNTLTLNQDALYNLTMYKEKGILQPGNILEIFVYQHPDFSRKVTVRSDGFITLPIIDEIDVAGKTTQKLDQIITEKLSHRLVNPEVTVFLENDEEPMVYVFGEIGRVTPLPLRIVKTVAQALASAGGVTEGGAIYNVSVIRLNNVGKLESITVDSSGFSTPEKYMALQNMALKSGDLIIVPESYRSQAMRVITDLNTASSAVLNPWTQIKILELFDRQIDIPNTQ